ncbi:MAG: 50S ribosomal protein L11 methyltransferase [Dehalococcoidia bacterium]
MRPANEPVQWIEVIVRVAPAGVDAVADALREVSPAGVSIEPAIRTLDHDNFQYELLDEPTTLRVCLAGPLTSHERRALRRRLAAAAAIPLPPIRYRAVGDQDWSEEWKRYFGVLHVGSRMVVRPSWETYEAQPDELVIELDPGTAFGTGQHETTRLCLAALEREIRPGTAVLDVGTGSGILAVGAVLLGAKSVRACDIDANAIAAAVENARRNGVEAAVDVRPGSVGPDWPWDSPAEASADLVVANISSVALVALMEEMAAALRAGGCFIGSGFIETGRAGVEAAVRGAGLDTQDMLEDGEWRCLVARKP